MSDDFRTSPAWSGDHCAPEDLSALLDGEVAGRAAAEIEAHLASCESCRFRREQLAEVRGLVAALVSPAPAGAAAAAVALAVDGSREGAAAPGGVEAGGEVVRLRRRQHRIRVAGIAAAILLAAGGVSGIVVAAGRGGTASSAPTAAHGAGADRSSPGLAEKSPPPPAGAPVQLRGSKDQFGPPLASLAPSDVEGIGVRPGPGGTFTATITLRRAHSLTRSAAAVLATGAAAVLSGRLTGTVHVLSGRLIEITGLTKSASAELKHLLG